MDARLLPCVFYQEERGRVRLVGWPDPENGIAIMETSPLFKGFYYKVIDARGSVVWLNRKSAQKRMNDVQFYPIWRRLDPLYAVRFEEALNRECGRLNRSLALCSVDQLSDSALAEIVSVAHRRFFRNCKIRLSCTRSVLVDVQQDRKYLLVTHCAKKGDVCLGEGACSKVKYAIDLTHCKESAEEAARVLAVKITRANSKSKKAWESFRQEGVILQSLQDISGVVRIVYSFECADLKYRRKLYTIMPVYQSNLLRILNENRMNRKQLIRLVLDVAVAIYEIHKRQIIHRDIKPENIFIYSEEGVYRAVLGDFGFAGTAPNVEAGSLRFFSPERVRYLQDRRSGWITPDYDFLDDVWAFSLVVYTLFTGRYLWLSRNAQELCWEIAAITQEEIDCEIDRWTGSLATSELLKSLIRVERFERPDMGLVLAMLHHYMRIS